MTQRTVLNRLYASAPGAELPRRPETEQADGEASDA